MSSSTKQRPRKRAATAKKKAAKKKSTAKKTAAATRKTSARKSPAKKKAAKRKRPGPKGAKPNRSSREKAGRVGGRSQLGARNLTARAEEVRRARRQRRKSVVIVLLALSVAAAAGIGLIRSPLMAIDGVVVRGAETVDEDLIVAAAAVEIGSPLVDLPIDATIERVEAIPEIKSATVTRSLSGGVEIVVTEREPTMALRSNGGFVLVDDDGRQVRTTVDPPDGFLPVIGLEATGVPGDPAPPGSTAVLRLMGELTPPVRSAVTEVIVTGDQLALRMRDGGRAVLGDDDQLAAKVVSLETLLLSVDLRCVHEIDLTVPSAPAVSRIGEKGNPRDGLADLTECS
ncbi:MAG: cell division protein FtsQ/DivIB [Acidimicrobiales bacterium]